MTIATIGRLQLSGRSLRGSGTEVLTQVSIQNSPDRCYDADLLHLHRLLEPDYDLLVFVLVAAEKSFRFAMPAFLFREALASHGSSYES